MRRKRILVYSTMIVLAAALIGVSVYAVVINNKMEEYKRQIVADNNQAFEAFVDDIQTLNTKFTKLEASSDKTQSMLMLMDIWRQAGSTEQSLSNLPMSTENSTKLMDFVNTMGDYTYQLSIRMADGGEMTDDAARQIKSIKQTCGELLNNTNTLWEQGYNMDVDTDLNANDTSDGTSQVKFLEQQMPRLIYDGPFSESVQNKKPQGLPNYTMTEQAALKKAAEFMGVTKEELEILTPTDGKLPTYNFGKTEGDRTFQIAVTKQGGEVLWFTINTADGLSILPTDERAEQLIEKAKKFVEGKGYPKCKESYVQYYDGNALVNLVPLKGDIKLYPDLIKVWVNLDSDEIVGMDVTNYVMSHRNRDLKEPKMSKTDVQKKLNTNLKVQSLAVAVIPLDTGKEALCYEFTCKLEDRDCIVYMDADTGEQRDVLLIEHTNEGTLTE